MTHPGEASEDRPMVEICKVLLAPALWVALLLLVASAATRGDPLAPQADLCGSPAPLTGPAEAGATR